MPPHDLDAEKAVLGSMMLAQEATAAAMAKINETVFYKEIHKKIYLAIATLFSQGQPVDILTVRVELERLDVLEIIGGFIYLVELTDRIPSAANVESYCDVVNEKAVLRQLITISNSLQNECYGPDADVEAIQSHAVDAVYETVVKANTDFTHIASILHVVVSEYEEAHTQKKRLSGIETGYGDFDRAIGCLQPGDYMILAARQSNGKTSLMLNIARNVAQRAHTVGIISLEMNAKRLTQRLLAIDSETNPLTAKYGQLTDKDWTSITDSCGKLSVLPIYIDAQRGQGLTQIYAKAKFLAMRQGIEILFIDYLGKIVNTTKYFNRNVELGMISAGLFELADYLQIPVVALHQMSRGYEKDNMNMMIGGKKPKFRLPTCSDLYESGHIEQDADIVTFISRPELHKIEEIVLNDKSESTKDLAIWSIAKARDGEAGKLIPLRFQKEYQKFTVIDYKAVSIPEENTLPF